MLPQLGNKGTTEGWVKSINHGSSAHLGYGQRVDGERAGGPHAPNAIIRVPCHIQDVGAHRKHDPRPRPLLCSSGVASAVHSKRSQHSEQLTVVLISHTPGAVAQGLSKHGASREKHTVKHL